jgi:hypothetical protein
MPTVVFSVCLVMSVWAGVRSAGSEAVDKRSQDDVVRAVRGNHPRLMPLDQDVPALRKPVREDRTLAATVLEPKDACFELHAADPPPPQAQQSDVHKILVRLKLPSGRSRVAAALCPGENVVRPELKPLATWLIAANGSRVP